jgi:hypothetical protein
MDFFAAAPTSTRTQGDAAEPRSPRPAGAGSTVRTAPRVTSSSSSIRYWFAFDRWLPVAEEDDFVLA